MTIPTQDHLHELSFQLRNAAFEGQADVFDDVISRYKKSFSDHDPHARLLLDKAANSNHYPFSFQSTFVDREYDRQQRNLRIGMWFKHLPLDLQFSFMMLDGLGWDFPNFPLDKVSLEQMGSVMSASDPLLSFISSPLYDPQYRNNPAGSKRLFEKRMGAIHRDARQLAWECLNHGMFDEFDQVLTRAKISPWEGVGSFMLHYRDKSSFGYHHINLRRPVPFWALGVFFPSADDRYWEIIQKHGGPSTPIVNGAPAKAPRNAVSWGKSRAAAPELWQDPMGWIDEKSMKEIKGRPEIREYINEVISTNLSFWKARSLSTSIKLPSTTVAKPRM